ncbi:MAG: FAD-dependent oxidoreductase [Pseudomonadota bacterium]
MAERQFKHLFSPLKIGKITVPNRVLQVGADPRFYPWPSAPNETANNYYEARARGEIAIIITEPHMGYSFTTLNNPTEYHSDRIIPIWKKTTDAIHQHGVRCFAQMNYAANVGRGRIFGGGALMSASNVFSRDLARPANQEVPHAMEKEDIDKALTDFREWARRAREAGYDGIEIAVIIENIFQQFLSPAYNLRTDEYGGSLENRMRLLLETIDAMRDGAGPDLVLGVRFTADEFVERVWWSNRSGYNLEDAKEIAKRLEATGKVDYLHPCSPRGATHIPPMYFPLGVFIYMAAAIKEVVNIPVFCDGRINDPVQAEKILADNQADMIGMYRALCADPEFVIKARDGRAEEIRKCIACNEGCVGPFIAPRPLSCTMNPEAGREKVWSIAPAPARKKVMIIGGGGAGLEAARVASLRGHEVGLYEKEEILARELTLAAKCPGRADWEEARRYWLHQMQLLKVEIHLGTVVTAETVNALKPDAVIVATGAKAFPPSWPGADAGNVVEGKRVLAEEVEVGQNVVLMTYENHVAGLGIAAFLTDRGKKVKVLAEPIYAAGGTDHHTFASVHRQMAEKGIVITALSSIKEVSGNRVVVYNMFTGAESVMEGVDTVVYVMDGRPNDALYHDLKGHVKERYLIGQALSPRRLLDSVADAYRVGNKI